MPVEDLGVRPLLADLTDYGQATEVLQGVDSVVQLANIPAPEIHTRATTFNQNMTMNFNVFTAAAQVGRSGLRGQGQPAGLSRAARCASTLGAGGAAP